MKAGKTNKGGRPKLQLGRKTRYVMVSLGDGDMTLLDEICAQFDMKRAAVMRSAFHVWMEKFRDIDLKTKS